MTDNKKDERIAYSANCTWWDSIHNVGLTAPTRSGHRLPCCPHCHSMLFEASNEREWLTAIDNHDKDHPGYRKLVDWGRGKCFPDYPALEKAYAERQAKS